MPEPGLNEFQNLSEEKQALAMFQMPEENRRMLREILEISRRSSFSDQSRSLLQHANDRQHWSESEHNKSATVHVNVGGKKHEVIWVICEIHLWLKHQAYM